MPQLMYEKDSKKELVLKRVFFVVSISERKCEEAKIRRKKNKKNISKHGGVSSKLNVPFKLQFSLIKFVFKGFSRGTNTKLFLRTSEQKKWILIM